MTQPAAATGYTTILPQSLGGYAELPIRWRGAGQAVAPAAASFPWIPAVAALILLGAAVYLHTQATGRRRA